MACASSTARADNHEDCQGVFMSKRKGKPVSFDAMVKFFMHNYNIPTKRDIEQLNARLDGLERLIRSLPARTRRLPSTGHGTAPRNATETVLDIIHGRREGIGIAEIKAQTGYGDKKLRNIIFRLNKMGRIARVNRGFYKAIE